MKCNRRRFLQYVTAASTALSMGNLNAISSSTRHSRVIPSRAEAISVIGMVSWLVFAIDPDNDEQLESREAVIREFLSRGGGMIVKTWERHAVVCRILRYESECCLMFIAPEGPQSDIGRPE